MSSIGNIFRSLYAFLFTRTQKEDLVAEYVVREHRHGRSLDERPAPGKNLVSQKMGIHEWSYSNNYFAEHRTKVPHADKTTSIRNLKMEVELGYDDKLAAKEVERCLNCDVQTVFTERLCIECDACVDICPMDCITFTENGEENWVDEA